MLTPSEFVAAWGTEGDPLARYPAAAVKKIAMADDDRAFLAEAGLPPDAAPFLSFESPSAGELRTVAERWKQPKQFARYRQIGSDGEGSPIAIDEDAGGEVVLLDHDSQFARVFMNKSIRQLAESLLAYRKMVQETIAANGPDAFLDGNIPDKARDELSTSLKRIEPAAVQPGSFWNRQLQALGADE